MPQTDALLYDSGGNPVTLGRELGSGGEGRVLEISGEISGDQSRVAKIYHKAISDEKAEKLSRMVRLQTPRLLNLAAWPVDTLHENPGGRMTGFVMQRITDHRPVHALYSPKSRLAEFPHATWPFLIQTAANIARAFAVIHEHGHVVGDVNHGNLVVSKQATVKLIDCDSFQIATPGRQHLCEVGVSTHTPPELQGQSFHGVVRTPNHDAFGLGVLIFQLLFLGRHPFSGRYAGRGEMPLEKAILEFRFAYGPCAEARGMSRPPGTLALEAVSAPVAALFEQAFLREADRPAPAAWVASLTELAENLRRCVANKGHYYFMDLITCPWCQIEGRVGVLLFNVLFNNGWQNQNGIDLKAVWSVVASVRLPGLLGFPPKDTSLAAPVAPEIIQARKERVTGVLVATGSLVAVAAILLGTQADAVATALTLLLIGIIGTACCGSGGLRRLRRVYEQALEEAQRGYEDVERRWSIEASETRFHEKYRELEEKKREYEGLPALRQKRLQELRAASRDRQLKKHLDQCQIETAQISGVGEGRKAVLRQHGIETAGDISDQTILAIPGFGPNYTAKLLDWRRSIEAQFLANPARLNDSVELETLEREFATLRAVLIQTLQNGPGLLLRVSQQISAAREMLRPVAENAARELAQAEANRKALSTRFAAFTPLGVAVVLIFVTLNFSGIQRVPRSLANSGSYRGERAPTPTTPSSKLQASFAKYDEAVRLRKAGRPEEALDLLRQAISLNPDMAEAYHEAGYILAGMEKFEEAVTALTMATRLLPKRAETYQILGACYESLNRLHDAATAYYKRGLLLKESNNWHEAVKAYQEAIKLNPYFADAHYELGLCHLRLRNPAAARWEYTVLVNLNETLANELARRINEYR